MDRWSQITQGILPLAGWPVISAMSGSRQLAKVDGSYSFSVVPKGQLTFDAEGIEQPGSIYHSRVPHVPVASSGITVGRGFDLGTHSPAVIRSFLSQAGFNPDYIAEAAAASGLRGKEAMTYLDSSSSLGEITPQQQWNLFNLTYETMEQDVRRISDKPDTVRKYGAVNWERIAPEMLELVTDLRYRGDYTPETRRKVQPYLVQNDIAGLSEVMNDRDYWVGIHKVPAARFAARENFIEQLAISPSGRSTY